MYNASYTKRVTAMIWSLLLRRMITSATSHLRRASLWLNIMWSRSAKVLKSNGKKARIPLRRRLRRSQRRRARPQLLLRLLTAKVSSTSSRLSKCQMRRIYKVKMMRTRTQRRKRRMQVNLWMLISILVMNSRINLSHWHSSTIWKSSKRKRMMKIMSAMMMSAVDITVTEITLMKKTNQNKRRREERKVAMLEQALLGNKNASNSDYYILSNSE